MRKKIITLIILSLFLCGSMASFAAAVDSVPLMTILDKANNHPRKTEYLKILRNGFKSDSGVDFLHSFTKKEMERIGQYGLTEKDLDKAFNDLRSMDVAERMQLVDYVEKGQMDKAKDFIESKISLPGGNNQAPGAPGSGSDLVTNPDGDIDLDPELDVDLNPEADKPQVTNFKDVKGHWAQKNIEKMTALKMVNGMTKDTFAPDLEISRSQMIALIVRILELNETTEYGDLPFTDIKKGDWDYRVVQIAYQAKLVSGTSATTFEPNEPISREEMMAMIISGLKYKDFDLTIDGHKDLKIYRDYDQISDWALNSMQQGVDLNLMAGKTKTSLDPKGTATRAEAVTILERVYNLLQ